MVCLKLCQNSVSGWGSLKENDFLRQKNRCVFTCCGCILSSQGDEFWVSPLGTTSRDPKLREGQLDWPSWARWEPKKTRRDIWDVPPCCDVKGSGIAGSLEASKFGWSLRDHPNMINADHPTNIAGFILKFLIIIIDKTWSLVGTLIWCVISTGETTTVPTPTLCVQWNMSRPLPTYGLCTTEVNTHTRNETAQKVKPNHYVQSYGETSSSLAQSPKSVRCIPSYVSNLTRPCEQKPQRMQANGRRRVFRGQHVAGCAVRAQRDMDMAWQWRMKMAAVRTTEWGANQETLTRPTSFFLALLICCLFLDVSSNLYIISIYLYFYTYIIYIRDPNIWYQIWRQTDCLLEDMSERKECRNRC